MRFVSEEQNYFCLKSEIKNASKYGKVMLSPAVISTKQLISSFLVMLHLTVFCLNQLWRAARTWKFLRLDGHPLNSLCLLHFEPALVPLCPHFTSLLPDFCFSCHFARTAKKMGGNEGLEWLSLEQNLYLYLKNRIPSSVLAFSFRFFSVNLFTVEEVEWQVDWRNSNLQCTVGNQTPFSSYQEFQPSGKYICRKLVLRTGIKNPSNFYKKEIKISLLVQQGSKSIFIPFLSSCLKYFGYLF